MMFQNYTTNEIIPLEDASPYVQMTAHNIKLDPRTENFYQTDPLKIRECTREDIENLLHESKDETLSLEKLLELKDNILCLDDPNLLDFQGQIKNDEG